MDRTIAIFGQHDSAGNLHEDFTDCIFCGQACDEVVVHEWADHGAITETWEEPNVKLTYTWKVRVLSSERLDGLLGRGLIHTESEGD